MLDVGAALGPPPRAWAYLRSGATVIYFVIIEGLLCSKDMEGVVEEAASIDVEGKLEGSDCDNCDDGEDCTDSRV